MDERAKTHARPPQHQQHQPGDEQAMMPQPRYDIPERRGCARLVGKVALITGGDSGIGRAVAIAYAKEGADVLISYLEEHEDAATTRRVVEEYGRRCIAVPGDIGDEHLCRELVKRCVSEFGRIDILVNNAAEQHVCESISELSADQIERTFRTNIFAMFYLVKAALPHMKAGGVIINTTSLTAYKGNPTLLDYSATKGAIVAFTRSLAMALIKDGIRVNAVAPGPIWTPLIPASFPPERVREFGTQTPMERAGEPVEVAPSYVFLASDESSYISGQVLHPNGGQIING